MHPALPFNPPAMPPQPLSGSLNERAVNFFFAHYVLSDPPFSHSYRRGLSQLYNGESTNQILHLAIESVGLAGMANVHRAPHLMRDAKRQYGRALALTNKTLTDPVQVKADSTILAVLFLGLFEVSV